MIHFYLLITTIFMKIIDLVVQKHYEQVRDHDV
jgi:hypothetical protein